MDHDLRILALFALFDLAREDRPAHVGNVAARLSVPRGDLVVALKDLERKGLCDAARCRLTMKGLLTATTLRNASTITSRSRVAA